MRLFLATFLALALPTLAQEKLVETLEVRVVNVDVSVTDRSGKPVYGLTKDDFTIVENGKPQTITNLYEIRPEVEAGVTALANVQAQAEETTPPEELRTRRVLIFVDNYSLNPPKRNQILKALETFLDRHFRAGDEAAIVMWSRGTHVITPFTTDVALLRKGVKDLAERGRTGLTFEKDSEEIKREAMHYLEEVKSGRGSIARAFDQSQAAIRAGSERFIGITNDLLEAMKGTMASLAGLEGKKAVVFAGANLPEKPGLDLWYWLDAAYAPYLPRNMRNQSPVMRAGSASRTFSIEKVAREANRNGVTMYMINASESRDASSAESPESQDAIAQFANFTNTAAAYQTMARITGGVSYNNISDMNVAFDLVAQDLSSYYSLGYRPSDDAPGGENRKITVRAKNPEYRVRSRNSYVARTQEEEVNDRLLANLDHQGLKGDWRIEMRTGSPQKTNDRFTVPVEVAMAPESLTLLPQGDKLVGGFDVLIVVGDDKGGRSKVTKTSKKVEIPLAAEKELRSRPLTFGAAILVRPGESTLSVAVIDQISSATGLARARINAQ